MKRIILSFLMSCMLVGQASADFFDGLSNGLVITGAGAAIGYLSSGLNRRTASVFSDQGIFQGFDAVYQQAELDGSTIKGLVAGAGCCSLLGSLELLVGDPLTASGYFAGIAIPAAATTAIGYIAYLRWQAE